MISQLSSLGVAPKAFSHCLKGAGSGGGILVLGEVVDLGIVYTPLVQDQYVMSYNMNKYIHLLSYIGWIHVLTFLFYIIYISFSLA